MNLENLTDWINYCSEAAASSAHDRRIAGSAWVASGVTPPPVLDDPLTRIPLDRSFECYRQGLGTTDLRIRQSRFETALQWLDHPHPRTSNAVRQLLAQHRHAVQQAMLAS